MKKKIRIISCFLFLVSLCVCVLGYERLSSPPYESEYSFTEPSYVYRMENGGMLIVEKSKTSVVVLNKNNEVKAVIKGGNESKDLFYYTDYAVTDGKYIYINDVHYGEVGVKVAFERIVRFDMKGKYVDTIFEKSYTDESDIIPMQYGLISGLEGKNGVVSFFLRESDGYSLYVVNGDSVESTYKATGEIQKKAYKFTYNQANQLVYFTTKTGEIYQDDQSAISCIHEAQEVTDGFPSIPWKLFTTMDGSLYYVDLGTRQIVCLTTGKVVVDAIEPLEESPVYYTGATGGEGITTTDGMDCYYVDKEGEILYQESKASYSNVEIAIGWLVWICAAIAAMIAIIIALNCIYYILSSSSGILKIGFWVATGVLIVSVMVTSSILTTTNRSATDKTLSQITTTTSILSQNLKGEYGDLIENISHLKDYDSEKFKQVKEYMDTYSNEAYNSGIYQYYLLYKFKDNVLYGVMDFEDTITDMQPYSVYEGTEYQQAVEENKVVSIGGEANSFGTWAYAAAPVYNSNNEVVGVIEVGTDLYSEQQQVQTLVRKITVSTVVLVVIILLLLTEGVYLSDFFEKRKAAKANGNGMEKTVLGYVRFLTFLVFFADSFQDSFIPVISSQLFQKSALNLDWLEGIGSALPMSLQLLFVALMALLGGRLIDRFNIREVLCSGLLIQMAGYASCAFALGLDNYILLLLGKTLVGSGMGMAVVSLNSIAASAKTETEKGSLFSGLNSGILSGIAVGVSVGAGIVSFSNYKGAFLGSAGVILLSVIFTLKFVFAEKRNEIEQEEKETVSMGRFISNKNVFSLLVFIIVPFLILMYFKDYLFPLYATEQGMSETSISNVFLFCGALLIYLGPGLTTYFLEKMGGKLTIILASVIYVIALLLFGVYPTLTTAIITVFLICLGASFGLANQSMYYSGLPAVTRYGDGKSMGVYSLFDNLGQTLGPILLGAMMILGYATASLILGIAAAVLLVLFVIFNLRIGRKNKGDM